MRFPCRNWHVLRATRASWLGTIRCMATAQVIDMPAAPVNVLHMSKMIQIRNVPDEMHRALKVMAAQEGMSLSDYIKRELGFVAGKSTIEEIAERRRARRGGRKRSRLTTEMTVQLIREGRGE